MIIQITQPEVEAIIQQRLKSGAFQDAEDVISQALRSSPEPEAPSLSIKTLDELFARIRGLAEDLDFSRNRSTGRPVDLT